MIGIGTGCFLQLPGKVKQRILHPARVVGLVDDVFTVETDESGLDVKADLDILLYYEKNREFMQQSARIESVDSIDVENVGPDENQNHLLVSFKTTGAPVSAESRQHYRVSAVITGYQADVADEKCCDVLDVSSTGLSVVSRESYTIGNVISIAVVEDGQTYQGNACVQSVRDLGQGRTRYGLHCVSETKSRGTLALGLQRASMRIQREQLRRLAGSA